MRQAGLRPHNHGSQTYWIRASLPGGKGKKDEIVTIDLLPNWARYAMLLCVTIFNIFVYIIIPDYTIWILGLNYIISLTILSIFLHIY